MKKNFFLTKRASLFAAWFRTYEGLQEFTRLHSLGTSVANAEEVVILRKAEDIMCRRLYLMDPNSKHWTD